MSDDWKGAAHVVRLSDVTVERVSWLWHHRIPVGKVTVIEGNPGCGKSTFTMELAACETTGTPLPDGPQREPGTVLLLTAEDGLGDTVRPRLEAAGGDPGRVHVLEGIHDEDGNLRFPSVPADLLPLAQVIGEVGATLVLVDPLTAYLGAEVNSWKDADVRRAMAPIAKIAEQTETAIVVIRHLTKQSTGAAITAGGGSMGIIGAARSGLLIAKDPDNPERRIIASVKSNLAQTPDSLCFRLEDVDGWARLRWDGTSSHTADRLVSVPSDPEEKSALDEAQEMLRDWLQDGPLPAREVQRLAREAGVADKTLRRAKSAAGVEAVKGPGKGSPWSWKMATAPPSGYLGHLAEKQGLTPSSDNGLKDGQEGLAILPESGRGHLVADATEDGLGACTDPLCGGRLARRRSGLIRCTKCMPNNPRDPYVTPVRAA